MGWREWREAGGIHTSACLPPGLGLPNLVVGLHCFLTPGPSLDAGHHFVIVLPPPAPRLPGPCKVRFLGQQAQG